MLLDYRSLTCGYLYSVFSLLTDIYIAYVKQKTLNIRNFGCPNTDSLNTAHTILCCFYMQDI